MRILLDTNVWLAILTTDGQCRRGWRAARSGSQVFASPQVLGELEDKLRLKFGFSARHARLLTHFVRRQSTLVEPALPLPTVCRDGADNGILAAALAGRCELLVTGDQDLLVLEEFQGMHIVTPAEFAKRVMVG
ncbi:MAG: putative toxin-antitoxin system toxin component, PIN family [Pedosphaera sp.]|nr:putative toxin-antitoxin system toxin component, PIN family [Pedosphaera sp.]